LLARLSGPLFTNIASCIVLYVIFKVLFPAPVNPARNCILTNTLVFVNTRFVQPGLKVSASPPRYRLRFPQARSRMLPYALTLCQRYSACISWQFCGSFSASSRQLFCLFQAFQGSFSLPRFQSAQI